MFLFAASAQKAKHDASARRHGPYRETCEDKQRRRGERSSIVGRKNDLFGLRSWLSKLKWYDGVFSFTRSHNGQFRLNTQSLGQKLETERRTVQKRTGPRQLQFTLLDNYSSFRIRGSYQWQMTLIAGKATIWHITLADSACHKDCVSRA